MSDLTRDTRQVIPPPSGTVPAVLATPATYDSTDLATVDSGIVDQIGVANINLLLDSSILCTASKVVPANCTLTPQPGGLITISNGVTLTVNSPFTAGPFQVFNCIGTGKVVLNKTIAFLSEWWGAMGDTTNGTNGTDDTIPMRAALAASEVDATYGGGYVQLQAKKYKMTNSLIPTKRDVSIRGKGKYLSALYFNGVATGCIVPATALYCRPIFLDFSIVGDAGSGHGIDFSNITGETYEGAIERLAITSGGKCLYSLLFFSMKVDSVDGSSFNDHTFHVKCGPAVTFLNCYAHTCGSAKAGWRLTGIILAIGCNCMDSGDYAWVFGSDFGGAADGFENDFPAIGYPDVTLINCNAESFNVRGIYFCQSVLQASLIGGKVDRNALATAYHSMISWKKSPVNVGGLTKISMAFYPGTGVPNGGAALTNAWLYSTVGSCQVVDQNGSMIAAGITGVYSPVVTGLYPLLTTGFGNENFQNVGLAFSSIIPRRLNVAMIRFVTAALTPVGAAQAIVVTGVSKVLVTPAAAASISTATFVATLGIVSDVGRNSDLIIEAVNANLTVNHTALGGATRTFVLTGGVNLAMGVGQVIRFLLSETTGQWIQY